MKVERRYVNEHFQQRARSNAERAERLARRIEKRAEAERLQAEADRIRIQEEFSQEEEARILEEEDRRKSDIELEMKEETIRVKLRVLDEVDLQVKSVPRMMVKNLLEDEGAIRAPPGFLSQSYPLTTKPIHFPGPRTLTVASHTDKKTERIPENAYWGGGNPFRDPRQYVESTT